MAKPRLVINLETLERLCDGQPWGVFAQQLGVDPSTISRVRSGDSLPSNEFIATIVTKFPVRMEDIVTVEADAA